MRCSWRRLGAGKRVVRLKGGDPLLFGRGAEEALALEEQGLRFEIIPGVTSAIAARRMRASRSRIATTRRSSRFSPA